MKTSLKPLLLKNKILVFPGCFNAFTAKLIEKNGFDGVYLSGAALANSLGVSDTGIIGLKEFKEAGVQITRSVNLPVIADADTGFDDIEKTVKAYIKAGLSGLHIEDQVFPKRCGHLSGKEVISQAEMIKKIKTAVSIKNKIKPDFLIIARTDARGAKNIEEKLQFEEALRRGAACLKAGADVIFPEALKSKEEFINFRKAIPGFLMVNMTEFGKSPLLTTKELEKMGYNLIIFPVTLFRYSAAFIEKALKVLKEFRSSSLTFWLFLTSSAQNSLSP